MTAPPISAFAYSPDAATGAAPAVLAVRQLRLTDFRNYRQLRLDCGPQPIVLVGANGAGKTNLLEALSFLAPGRGLRRARRREVVGEAPASREQGFVLAAQRVAARGGSIQSERADIVDRNGAVLATSVPVMSAFVNPRLLLDPQDAARKIVDDIYAIPPDIVEAAKAVMRD